MTRITELSTKDLLKLSEKDIEHYVQVELMHEGIVVPPMPEKPEQFVLTKTVKVWKIRGDGSNLCTFPNQEIAQAVLAASQGQFMTENYLYKFGYDKKFMACCSDCVVVAEDVYDEQELSRYENQLSQSRAAQEDYEKLLKTYNKVNEEAIDIRERVLSVVNTAKRDYIKATQLSQTFSKYIVLADGSRQVALAFLLRTFTESEIDKANELLDNSKKIMASAISMP